MTRITWYMADLHAAGHIRGELLARELNANYPTLDAVCKQDITFSDMLRSHVMVFQRSSDTVALERIRAARSKGILTIYDVDDDMLNVPEGADVHAHFAQPDVRNGIAACMQAVDAITCPNVTLARSVGAVAPNVPKFIVDNGVDVEKWATAYEARLARTAPAKDGDAVTLMWMASNLHKLDAALVGESINTTLDKYPQARLRLIGSVGADQFPWIGKYGDRVECIPWVPIHMLPASMSDGDVGLCPIVDNPYNRARSALKAYQYWTLGMPVVASCLPPYTERVQDGMDGLLVGPSGDEWTRALERVMTLPVEKRVRMGRAGRKKVLEYHTVKAYADAWVKVLRTMGAIAR